MGNSSSTNKRKNNIDKKEDLITLASKVVGYTCDLCKEKMEINDKR